MCLKLAQPVKIAERFAGMSPAGLARQTAADLPMEIWAKVFHQVGPKPHSDRFPPLFTASADLATQSHFCHLPLVCKRFRDVSQQHPELPSCVDLEQGLSSTQLASLTAWLQPRAAKVQSLLSACEDQQVIEQVFRVLCQASSSLAQISCRVACST